MRLTESEIAVIREAAHSVFGSGVVVRLFGSRLDDDRRGGDIDLHFELHGGRPDAAMAARFRDRVESVIGERAIDLVFHDPDAPLRSIDRAALKDGIAL